MCTRYAASPRESRASASKHRRAVSSDCSGEMPSNFPGGFTATALSILMARFFAAYIFSAVAPGRRRHASFAPVVADISDIFFAAD